MPNQISFVVLFFFSLVCFAGCEKELTSVPFEPVEVDRGPNCDSVESCVDIVNTRLVLPDLIGVLDCASGIIPDNFGNAKDKLVEFGDEAVEALIPFLSHSNCQVRKRAGYVINQIPKIEPEHANSLIEAHNSGVPWLEMPIGRTQTDEALDFLWLQFLYDPQEHTNVQAMMGLASFEDRVHPKIEPVIRRCKFDIEARVCLDWLSFPDSSSRFQIQLCHCSKRYLHMTHWMITKNKKPFGQPRTCKKILPNVRFDAESGHCRLRC